MKKASKRYKKIEDIKEKFSDIHSGVVKIKDMATAKFEESIDVSIKFNIQKKHTIRDTVSFPHAFGKTKKVLAIVKEDKIEEAKKAGADFVGNQEFIDKISKGWLDFDVAVTTPNMMRDIARVARILGSKGLMPNPKTKTVTENIAEAIKEVKAGRKEFRADPNGNLNFSIGKKSMTPEAIVENYKELFTQVMKKKPSDLKGEFIQSISLTTTMGKSISLDKKVV